MAPTDHGPGNPRDPFPQYETEEESEAGGGDTVADHLLEEDPHTQYETGAEVVERFSVHEATADAHAAENVTFTPAGTIAATDVQAAIEEAASEAGAHPNLATHDALGLATDAELAAHVALSFHNVKDYLATGDGTTDDTTAVAAAITAAGAGTVVFPKGTYLVNTAALVPVTASKWVGAGRGASIIKCSTADQNLIAPPAGLNKWTATGLTFQNTNTAGHLFAPAGSVNTMNMIDVGCIQNNPAKSIWSHGDFGYIDNLWLGCILTHNGATSVPSFNFVAAGNTSRYNSNTWQRCQVNHEAAGASYFFHIESDSNADYNYDNVFRDITAEITNGGVAKILTGNSTSFENVHVYDLTTTTADLFYIGAGTGGVASRHTQFINVGRRGGTLGGSLNDIALQSGGKAVGTHFYNVRLGTGGSGFTVELNSNTQCTATGCGSTTFNNANADFAQVIASAPVGVDYLVGTANATLTGEIAVGTTPGGELGNTWASPTVDASHSGSTHAATQAAAEATAANATNLTSGTVAAGRLPALTGNVTSSAGSAATTLAAGSAAVLNSGILPDARMPDLTGDVTTSEGAVATTIAANAVTYAKMQDVSATNRFLGRISSGSGDTEELTAANAKTILALVAGDLPAHGATEHTDITRSLWLPAPLQAESDSGTGNTSGTFPDAMRLLTLADGATQGSPWKFLVPSDWASGALTCYVYWFPVATDATPHTVRWSWNYKELAAGGDVTAAGTTTTQTGSSAARTAQLLVIETAQAILTPSAVNTLIRLDLQRIGADAADTYVGNVRVAGLRVDYTATQ